MAEGKVQRQTPKYYASCQQPNGAGGYGTACFTIDEARQTLLVLGAVGWRKLRILNRDTRHEWRVTRDGRVVLIGAARALLWPNKRPDGKEG